ncbi:hypothetical protein A2V49_02155 [candidate division WWE3 bacterium RBG_19FT_COMBO_34_6]|uniref:Uncharacterized protein n=1 Tax=candidate division WWE3 bacterium RBG_19FT_COMBO_34_6 TaxID=1802612 RepID=A0A1F4UN58_UNCKA|nr:MAG: hypothetical protein A2V49_02155 [candidate division WWE3 bacterium RBG_19FT_COMBO_34_6]
MIDGDIDVQNLTVHNELSILAPGTLNCQGGTTITGTPNLANGAFFNFSTGSLVEGDLHIGNSAVITVDSNSSVNINGSVTLNNNVTFGNSSTVIFPTETVTVSPLWNDSTNDYPVVPPSGDLVLIKVGNMVTAYIPGFTYSGIGNEGFFYIPWTDIDASFLPTRRYTSSCPIINNNISLSGYIYADTAQNRFEIRVNGLNPPNANDRFTGSNGTDQALGSSYTIDGGNIISFTYYLD